MPYWQSALIESHTKTIQVCGECIKSFKYPRCIRNVTSDETTLFVINSLHIFSPNLFLFSSFFLRKCRCVWVCVYSLINLEEMCEFPWGAIRISLTLFTLIMEAVSTSETSVNLGETTRWNIPENSHHLCRCIYRKLILNARTHKTLSMTGILGD
jgi:hypothetical protein